VKPILVGELNPYGADPRHALFPLPAGASGDRLREILGMGLGEYLRTFDRVNLCVGKWSLREARRKAGELLADHSTLILLGARVCAAFSHPYRPFRIWRLPARTFVVLPHPSGRCRAWNEPSATARAREVVGRALAAAAGEAQGRVEVR
jgi:hypothetical protein